MCVLQARSVVGGCTGLIPSQYLEEKRKAFVRKDSEGSGMLGIKLFFFFCPKSYEQNERYYDDISLNAIISFEGSVT